MSLESAKSFFERIQKDDDFRAKVKSFKDDKKAKWDFLKKEGFDFTKEECDKVKSEYVGKISDEVCKQAAGGHHKFPWQPGSGSDSWS